MLMKKFIFCPSSAELECYCMSYNKCMISPNCSKCFPNHPACNLYLQCDVMECLSKKLIFKAAQKKMNSWWPKNMMTATTLKNLPMKARKDDGRNRMNSTHWSLGYLLHSRAPPHRKQKHYEIDASSIGPFTRPLTHTSHSLACSALLALPACAYSYVHSLSSSWERRLSMNWMRRFHAVSTHCAMLICLLARSWADGKEVFIYEGGFVDIIWRAVSFHEVSYSSLQFWDFVIV